MQTTLPGLPPLGGQPLLLPSGGGLAAPLPHGHLWPSMGCRVSADPHTSEQGGPRGLLQWCPWTSVGLHPSHQEHLAATWQALSWGGHRVRQGRQDRGSTNMGWLEETQAVDRGLGPRRGRRGSPGARLGGATPVGSSVPPLPGSADLHPPASPEPCQVSSLSTPAAASHPAAPTAPTAPIPWPALRKDFPTAPPGDRPSAAPALLPVCSGTWAWCPPSMS